MLKAEIQAKRTLHYDVMYKLLSELYDIEKKFDHSYTLRQLAEDNELHEQWVYRIMSWRKASVYAKQQVNINRIGMAKACRILSKVEPSCQDDVIKYVIDKELTDAEIDRYVMKYSIKKSNITAARSYKNRWNIYRDIERCISQLRRCLDVVDKLPKTKKASTLLLLKQLKKDVDNVIKKLR